MPRLNSQHQALMGVGNGIVSLDGKVIDTNSGCPRWSGARFIYQKIDWPNTPTESVSIRLVDGESNTELEPKGANELFACPGIMAAWLSGQGVRLMPNGQSFPNMGPGDGSLNAGHLLTIKDYQSGNGVVDIMTSKEYDIKGINSLRAYDDFFVVRQGNIAQIYDYDGNRIETKGLASGTAACKVGQEILRLYNYGKYLVLHPSDSLMGRVITANDSAFNPDVVDNGTSICIVYSLGAGEYPGELIKVNEAEILAIPTQDLSKLGQVVIPPVVPPVSGGLKKPKITVQNWTLDELKNGREFKVIDRENSGFGARVWINNGSMYFSLTNPIGSGQTGMARLVKECNSTPIPIPPIPPIEPPTPVPSISEVRVDGLVFRNKDNSIFPYRGVSAFLLLRRLLEGDVAGVKSYCDYWSKLGYTVLRVFSQVNWTGSPGPGLYPIDYSSNYWATVDKLFTIAAGYNLHVEFVHHTFAYDLDAMAQWSASCTKATVLHKNVFEEIANEPPRNGIDISALLGKINTSLFKNPWSTGQYDPTTLPAGTYCTPHTPRDNEWPRKAKNLLEYRQGGGPEAPTDPAMQRPIVADEPMGAGEVDIPGRRSTNKLDFYTYAALSQLYGAGSTFHHEDGLNANLPGPIQAECASFFAKGAQAIWTDAQLGQYTRVGLSSSPIEEDDTLRTYGMILGKLAIFVRVRPNAPLASAKLKPGWVITSSDPYEVVVTLSQL